MVLKKAPSNIIFVMNLFFSCTLRAMELESPNPLEVLPFNNVQRDTIDDVFHAARAGDVAYVRDALEDGVDSNAQDSSGYTFLHIAAGRCHEPLVKLLLKRGADARVPSAKGRTPLHSVADSLMVGVTHESCKRIAHLLLRHDACINAKDTWGDTPLSLTFRFNQSLSHFLVSRGADLSLGSELSRAAMEDSHFYYGSIKPRLFRLAHELAKEEPNYALIQWMANNNLHKLSLDEHGSKGLHLACAYGHEKAAHIFLAHGADPSAQDNHGRTPIDIAWRCFNAHMVPLFLEAAYGQRFEETEVILLQKVDDLE